MIRHVYLYCLKKGADKQEVVRRLMELKRIPYMIDLEIGLDFKGAENSFELIEICTFASKEDFLRFGDEPLHCQIRAYMDGVRSQGVKIDYEVIYEN